MVTADAGAVPAEVPPVKPSRYQVTLATTGRGGGIVQPDRSDHMTFGRPRGRGSRTSNYLSMWTYEAASHRCDRRKPRPFRSTFTRGAGGRVASPRYGALGRPRGPRSVPCRATLRPSTAGITTAACGSAATTATTPADAHEEFSATTSPSERRAPCTEKRQD